MIGETEAPPAGVSGGSNQPRVPASDRGLNLVGSSARTGRLAGGCLRGPYV